MVPIESLVDLARKRYHYVSYTSSGGMIGFRGCAGSSGGMIGFRTFAGSSGGIIGFLVGSVCGMTGFGVVWSAEGITGFGVA
jgi:hypothetical protein